MNPDFKKLGFAICYLQESIEDCYNQNICNNNEMERVIDLHFNDVINNNDNNLSCWQWQIVNTIAEKKEKIDIEINNIISDLEKSLSTIHNTNYGTYVMAFVNKYNRWLYCNSRNEVITEIKDDDVTDKDFNFWVETDIAIKYATKKMFIAIKELISVYSINIVDELQHTINIALGKENYSKEEPQTPILPNLPAELSTPEAMKYWKKAQEAGLIDSNYNWLKSKVLLACFVEEMSDKLDLGEGYNYSRNKKRTNWKIFENLIKLKGYNPKTLNLRGSINDILKTGDNPLNINLVNDVFK